MSLDLRLVAVSDETPGSDMSESFGCGLKRPTWLTCGDGPGQCSRVCQLALSGPELPAAYGRFFGRDRSKRGQRRGASARFWAPIGGLSRAVRVYQLVGFTLARVQVWRSLGSFRPTTERGAAAPGGHHCIPLLARSQS